MVYTFGQINDATGFANGDQFTSEAQVREYFTVENMRLMFSGECPQTQAELGAMADAVVENRWHMAEASPGGVIGRVDTPWGAMDTQPRPWTDEGYWNVVIGAAYGEREVRQWASEAGQTIEQYVRDSVAEAQTQMDASDPDQGTFNPDAAFLSVLRQIGADPEDGK